MNKNRHSIHVLWNEKRIGKREERKNEERTSKRTRERNIYCVKYMNVYFFIIQTKCSVPNTKWNDVKKHVFFLCYFYLFSDILSPSLTQFLIFLACSLALIGLPLFPFFLLHPFHSIVVRLKAMSNSFFFVCMSRICPIHGFQYWRKL